MTGLNKKDIVSISKLLKRDIKFYAHIKDQGKELLQNHIDLSNKYFFKIYETKDMENIFRNFEKSYLEELNMEQLKLFKKLLINIVNFHDIGKINPLFQSIKMNNKIIDKSLRNEVSSKHSIISAILYIEYFIEDVKAIKSENKYVYSILIQILYLNAYIISRHHSNLNDFEEFIDSINPELYQDGCKAIEFLNENYHHIYNKNINISSKIIYKTGKTAQKSLEKNTQEKSIDIYIYTRLVYSILVACDFYATSEFMNNVELNEFGDIKNIDEFYSVYKKTNIYKSIRNYEKNEYTKERDLSNEKNINILRTEMFLDAEKELMNSIEKNIFFLEAPTGSGKSNVSMNLSFKLLEDNKNLRRIYYIYPFNTLIDQNMKTIEKIFNTDDSKNNNILDNIAVINSINPIKIDIEMLNNEEKTEDCNYEYYSKALLNRQFLNYSMILTTHVSLFNNMFNSSKESAFAFHQLANSVIVLDEIQSYKNTIWSEIITFLKGFAKILNIKFIIMSATLPNLNYLTNSNEDTIALINKREKYFENRLFKHRVVVKYDLMDKDIDEVLNHIKENGKGKKKILVEFIKKKSAYDFYNKLKEDKKIISTIELLTGDDNIVERQRILKNIENTEDIILVATQVIEAGVDIDMDVGYKDISKLDSEEQFMGRINRSCKKTGEVYFFNIDKADTIYKNDLRINKIFTLLDENMRKVLINKNFQDYYNPILSAIRTNYNESFSEYNLEEFFKDCVGALRFTKVQKRMKLIEEDMWSMSIYLSRTIDLGDGSILDGDEVWNNYKALLNHKDLEYAYKEIQLSQARSLLNYFIYQIKKSDIPYNDRIGDLYYIEDGEKYFKDNKVDKEKLITGIGDFI